MSATKRPFSESGKPPVWIRSTGFEPCFTCIQMPSCSVSTFDSALIRDSDLDRFEGTSYPVGNICVCVGTSRADLHRSIGYNTPVVLTIVLFRICNLIVSVWSATCVLR